MADERCVQLPAAREPGRAFEGKRLAAATALGGLLSSALLVVVYLAGWLR